jgi:hypothetical protein
MNAFADEEDLGVFRQNRARPIHRWYPFIEGYSEGLVREALDRHGSGDVTVFDPFGGCGTTALAAATMGRDTFFAEVNPYLAWVAHVKVNEARDAVNHPDLSALARLADDVESGRRWESDRKHPLVVTDIRRHFFPDGVADGVTSLLDWVDGHLASPIADLAKLACATALIPASNMVRRTDLRRRHSSDPAPVPWRGEVGRRLRMVLSDVELHGSKIRGAAIHVGGDVRQLPNRAERANLVVTSPPYLNGTNYVRNTKLELLALRFITSEADLADIRNRGICAGINNVSSRRSSPEPIASVESVARRLDEVAYDRRIPTLVRAYFSDMRVALCKIRSFSSEDAHLYLDIGDSRFAGVMVPTHDLLTEVGEDVGWRCLESTVLRARKSYDGTALTQVLLHFVAR